MKVDDSWFSPNYHQLSPAIIHMVKQPKKFAIVDNSLPAVARAKSRKQVVVTTRKNGPKAVPGSHIRLLDVISGQSLLHLAALPIFPQKRLVIRFFFCSVSPNQACELTLSVFGRYLLYIISVFNISFVMIIILNINTNFWSCSWGEELTSPPIFWENSWPKTIMNYHTRGETR